MQTSGQSNSNGGKGLTTVQMKTMSIYQNAGWAGKGWVINDGVDYPRLSWENTGGIAIPSAVIPFAGSGTAADPYRITTAQEFALLSRYSGILNKQIRLEANLDLSGIALYPIGVLGDFTGVFDGNSHTISNAVIHQSGNDYVGLFSRLGSGGQIMNLGAVNADIQGRSNVGGLVGDNSGTLTACFWDIQTSSKTVGVGYGSSAGATGKTTAEMKTLSTFTGAGWDFVGETANGTNDTWMMNGYPILSWQTTVGISGTTSIVLADNEQGQIAFNVFNLSDDAFNWTITGYESCTWITSISPVSGSSAGPTDITPVTLAINATGLAVGDYSCTLTVSADNGYTQSVTITLSVYDRVDMEEFSLLASYWGMTGCTAGQPCAAVDWFTDGTIDILGLIQLAQSWLGEEVATGTPSIQDGFETGNFTGQNWQQGGNLAWTIVSNMVYEGSYAARSGAITHSQTSSISFTADTTGFTSISFAYKVSSESGYDYLRFYIDGVQQNRWSGTVDWSAAEFSLSSGTHTFKWEYSKDSSVSSGSDCAWIDAVKIYVK